MRRHQTERGWNGTITLLSWSATAILENLGMTNAYPGAACDVQSHLYSFSFERNPDWSMQFSPQEEILHYLEHCADKYGITSYIRYKKNIAHAAFDEVNALWRVTTSDGEVFSAKALIS